MQAKIEEKKLVIKKPDEVKFTISSSKNGESSDNVSTQSRNEISKEPPKQESPKQEIPKQEIKPTLNETQKPLIKETPKISFQISATPTVPILISDTPNIQTPTETQTVQKSETQLLPETSKGKYIPPNRRNNSEIPKTQETERKPSEQEQTKTPTQEQKPSSNIQDQSKARQNGLPQANRQPSPQARTTESRYLSSQDDITDSYSQDESEEDAVYSDDEIDETPTGVKKCYNIEALMEIREKVIKNLKERKVRLDQGVLDKLKSYLVYMDKPTLAIHPDENLKKKKKQQERKPSKKPIVKLTRSENAWVPGSLNTNNDVKEKVKRTMNDILNKITPEKFDRLMKSLLDMEDINNPDCIEVMVNCIQEKALLEPKFSDLYAKLCFGIVQAPSYKSNAPFFRKALLNAAEKEFQKKPTYYQDDNDEHQGKSAAELEEIKTKERLRALGNISFLGELFRMKILSSKIIHEVVKDLLLRDPTPEKIEVVCQLLTSVGQLLESQTKEAEKIMSIYFIQLQKIVNAPSSEFNTRIIFLIESVIELRENNWVPRIKEEKAKKLNQVIEDQQREEIEKRNELKKAQGKSKKPKVQDADAGWQTTTTNKRKQEAKASTKGIVTPTVATKGKFAAFSDSVESPVSPALSEIEEFNESEVKKKITYLINSYLEDPNEDPISEISKFLDISSYPTLIPITVFELCTNPKLDTDACSELFNKAISRSIFNYQHIDNAFSQFYEKVLREQIFLDSALVYKTMAGIAPQFISLDRIHDIFTESQEKYPLAGAKIDDIAFFICEALRQVKGESIQNALRKNQRFVTLHCVDTTKKIQLGLLLKQEGIKSLKGDLYDIWALEHVMSNVDFKVEVDEYNARSIVCGLITGVELAGSSEEKYSSYKEKLLAAAKISPQTVIEELKKITLRFKDGTDRFEKSKKIFVALDILSQNIADSVKSS